MKILAHSVPSVLAMLPILAFAAIQSDAAPAALPAGLERGLVLYYDFASEPATGTVVDQSGHGNNGQAVSVRWIADGRNGGGCVQLDRSGSYITVPNSDSLIGPQFTLAAWIKTDYADSIWRRIFDKGVSKEYAVSVCGDWPAGDPWRRGMVALELGAGGAVSSGMRLADGRWHHVVATFDGTKGQIYADGYAVGSELRGGRRRPDTSFPLTIGANRSTPDAALGEVGASFDGQMADVMVYDRALSGAEVRQLLLAQGGVLAAQSPVSTAMSTPADLKYGLYIHYGTPTFAGAGQGAEIPASQFGPATPNVKAWAHAAREAGMTFAVLTVKHESGFCLWDSADYDYDIAHSPMKTDIIAEFIAACDAEGIAPGVHYSIPDSYNEGVVRYSGRVPQPYFNIIKKHITELHTKYPDLRVQIFDTSQRLLPDQWDELAGIVHRLNPQCLILDQFHAGTIRYTPASTIRGWMWRSDAPLNSAGQLFRVYTREQEAGGAFILSVGPDPEGNIPGNQLAVLTQMKQMIANPPVENSSSGGVAVAPDAKPDAASRLKQVKALYEQGLINKDEYDKKIKEILDSM